MANITIKPDCGNAPKMQFIKDFNIAFVEKDFDFIEDSISDDIAWTMIGDSEMNGKEETMKMIANDENPTITDLQVDNIITHGHAACANGFMAFDNGQKFYFCDVYEFAGLGKVLKFKKITSYVIEVE